MTKRKSTKRALLLSALSLLLCVSMLIGSTFAWFTDSVTSKNNIIKAGNLDVELEYKKVVDGAATDWASVKDQDNIFDKNALWEPGHVEVVYLKVTNLGSLALKYQLSVNVYNEIIGKTEDSKDIKLSDHLVFATVASDSEKIFANRDEVVKAAAGTAKGLKDYNGKTTALEVNGVDYLTLIVYMPETVGNEANYRGDAIPTIELGINLYATQFTAEEDSFNKFYDEEAWVDGMKVYNAADLISALGNEDEVILVNDIETTDVIELKKDVAINLNGKTLTASLDVSDDVEISIKNGTIANTNKDVSGIQINKGNVTLTDVEITSARHGVRVEGGEVVINDGTYEVIGNGMTQHALNVSDGGKVTINGGTFIGPKGSAADSGSAVNVQANSTVIINGGNFSKGLNSTLSNAGTLTVYGGTFDQNPAAYVADDYKAVANNGKYVVVADTIDSVVSTAAELATAIANGGVVYVADDIDMANGWTSVKPTREMTILGNGNTITNLNLPLLAGNVSTKVTINGLTVADSTVAPAANENGLGSAAFIPYVDAYGNVTFEDCHVKNSTINGNERAAGLVGYFSGQSVTIKNCSVENCEISAVGGAAGLVAYSQSVTTIENSSVKNTKVTATEDRQGTKLPLAGAVIGTVNANTTLTNVAVSGNTVSNNNAKAVFNDCIGRWVAGELTIDGAVQKTASSQSALNSAVASANKVEVTLTEGKYTMPGTSGDVTISGTKDTVITVSGTTVGSNVTFDGVTVKGSGYSTGMNAATVTYNNATIEGEMCLYREKVVFNDCTFNLAAGQYIWTYGAAEVEFNNCTFNTAGKAILIYNEGDGASAVSVKGCTFNATAGATAGDLSNQNCAAIEINNWQSGNGSTNHSLITENNTVDEDFSGEWRIKKYVASEVITVNGVTYTQPALDGTLLNVVDNKVQ